MSAMRNLGSIIASALLLAIAPLALAQDDGSVDPPDRVMRLAYQSGDVEFAAAGESDWGNASVNRPLTTGDQIETGDDGRVALELGSASVRVDSNSAFDLLDLEDNIAQFSLQQGTLNMSVRDMDSGETYEVDTPTIAFVANAPGIYRVDDAPNGDGSMVTVFSGSGTIYGENGVNMPAEAGHSYRIDNPQLADIDDSGIPAADDFDRFCSERDERYARSESSQYVPDDMVGYNDLDGYGEWDNSSDYGNVWYPTRVANDWAPYRDGRWEWINPWGWTWVDNAPWGFAPSHYGRWAYISHRWGWIPGGSSHGHDRHHGHSVYAPALVAFIGGSGFSIGIGGDQPVGWFPLGPRDVYQPPYRVSRNYFSNVNAGHFDRTHLDNAFKNYNANRPDPAIIYNNRSVPGAVTVVPRNVFIGARPVASAALRIDQQDLARANIEPALRIMPNAASREPRTGVMPARGADNRFVRPNVVRHPPPAAVAPISGRVHVSEDQGGTPLVPSQMHDLRPANGNDARQAPVRGVITAPHGDAGDAPARNAYPVRRTLPYDAKVQDAPATGDARSERFTRPRASVVQAPAMQANPQTTNDDVQRIAPQQQRLQQRAPRQQAQVVPVPAPMPQAREQPRPIRAPVQRREPPMQETPRVQPVQQQHAREAAQEARRQEARDKAEQKKKDEQDQQEH